MSVLISKEKIAELANVIPGAINKYLYYNNIIQEAKKILGVESSEVKVMEEISNTLLYNLKKLTTYRNKLKDDDDHKDLQNDYNDAISYLFKYEGPISDKNRFIKVDNRTKEFKLNLKVSVEGKEYPVSFTTLEALSIKLLNSLKFNKERIDQLKSLNSLNQALFDAKNRLGNLEEDSEKKLSTIAGNINKYNNGFYFFKNRKALKILNGLFPSVSLNVDVLLMKVNDCLTKLSDGKSLNEEEMINIEGVVKFVSGELRYERLTESQKKYIKELTQETKDGFVYSQGIKLSKKEIETHEASLQSLEDNLKELNDYDKKLNKVKNFINTNQKFVKKFLLSATIAVVLVGVALGFTFKDIADKKNVNNLQNDINYVQSDVDKSIQENEDCIDECLKNVVSNIENLEAKSASWNLMVNGDQAIQKLKTYSDFIKNYLTIEKDENGKITSIELKSAEELEKNSLKSLEIIGEPKTPLDLLNNLSIIASREYSSASKSSADLKKANSYEGNINDDLKSIEGSVGYYKDVQIEKDVLTNVDMSSLNNAKLGGTVKKVVLSPSSDNSVLLKVSKQTKNGQIYIQFVKAENASTIFEDGKIDATEINQIIKDGAIETYVDYLSEVNNPDSLITNLFVKNLDSALMPGTHEVQYKVVTNEGTFDKSITITNSKGNLTKDKILEYIYEASLEIFDQPEIQ